MVPTPPTDDEKWEPDETVRIIRTEDDIEDDIEETVPFSPSEIVSSPASEGVSSVSSPSSEASLGEVSRRDGGGLEGEVSRRDAGRLEDEVSQGDGPGLDAGDDVGILFASLRGAEEEPESTVSDDTQVEASQPVPVAETVDWIEERDTRLLPIANRALRGAKKAITELQNIALDNLRTDESWRPEAAGMADALQADLIGLWAESFAAGHSVAELMTSSKIKRPKTPNSDATAEFSTDLKSAVAGALDKSGKGQRERQSAASKVFSVWRSDEAERRIRQLAIRSYELGIETSVHVDA